AKEAAHTAPRLSRPAWRRATAVLAALLVLAACYPLVHSDYVGQRFAATATDFQLRVRHWSSTLAIMDDSAITASIGMGFGKFPSTYYWRNPAQETAPGYRFVDQSANRVLRLAAGAYAAGYGELLRIWQTVAIDAGHDYRLAIDVRNLSNMAFLHLRVCERQLLYPVNCRALPLRRLDSEPGWQHLGLTFNSGALGSRAAPVRLELAAEGPGAVFDVDNVSLRSMPEDREVLRNGDFTDASDYWFFSSDRHHLPWHVKNLMLNLYFDLGWLGVLAWSTLWLAACLPLLRRLVQGKQKRQFDWLAALAGLQVVGLFDSLLDVPRIVLLAMLVLGAASLHQVLPATRRPVMPGSSQRGKKYG
ncbi:MAG: hypothetical protein ABW069_14370, partial [Duganella sp.]